MTADSLLTGSRGNQRLRIDFAWQTDRYQQALWLIAGEREICALKTVEGTAQQAWPSSPPLQHLHQHETPAGEFAALAVGMAGTSHWSLAVEASADRPKLCCDVACRVKEAPEFLAVTWVLGKDVVIDTNAERSVALSTVLGRLRITADESDEFAAELSVGQQAEQGSSQICLSPRRTTATPPTTLRWRYRIELE